jgi:hypothetical protein
MGCERANGLFLSASAQKDGGKHTKSWGCWCSKGWERMKGDFVVWIGMFGAGGHRGRSLGADEAS